MKVMDGETVKLTADFTGFEGGHIDPDNITLNVYDVLGEPMIDEVNITSHYKVSAGVYCYEYPIPLGTKGDLLYEFLGYINGAPIVIRDILRVVKYLEDDRQPTLYGD
jgi:hypothetical protein